MTQEHKPKKKKLSLMSVLADPGKAVAELMDDPDIVAKLPEVLAKCPPAAMQVLACSIAPYLPETRIGVDEVALAIADTRRPLVQEETASTDSAIRPKATTVTGNLDGLSEIRGQLTQLAALIKTIQDDLPTQIQAQVSTVFKAELEAFLKRVELRNRG